MTTPPPTSWKTGFGRRLSYYLIGFVLGLLLLMMFQMAKNAGTP